MFEIAAISNQLSRFRADISLWTHYSQIPVIQKLLSSKLDEQVLYDGIAF
jgi:hypothetical protein